MLSRRRTSTAIISCYHVQIKIKICQHSHNSHDSFSLSSFPSYFYPRTLLSLPPFPPFFFILSFLSSFICLPQTPLFFSSFSPSFFSPSLSPPHPFFPPFLLSACLPSLPLSLFPFSFSLCFFPPPSFLLFSSPLKY